MNWWNVGSIPSFPGVHRVPRGFSGSLGGGFWKSWDPKKVETKHMVCFCKDVIYCRYILIDICDRGAYLWEGLHQVYIYIYIICFNLSSSDIVKNIVNTTVLWTCDISNIWTPSAGILMLAIKKHWKTQTNTRICIIENLHKAQTMPYQILVPSRFSIQKQLRVETCDSNSQWAKTLTCLKCSFWNVLNVELRTLNLKQQIHMNGKNGVSKIRFKHW